MRPAIERTSPADLMQLASDLPGSPMQVAAVLVLGAASALDPICVTRRDRSPGDEAALLGVVATTVSRRLPARRPLWSATLVTSLADGRAASACRAGRR